MSAGRDLQIGIGKTEVAMGIMISRDSFHATEKRASASSDCAGTERCTILRANTTKGLQGSTDRARMFWRARAIIHIVSTIRTKKEKVTALWSYCPELMHIDDHINGAMGGQVATPCEAPWEAAGDICPVETIKHPHPEMVDQFAPA